MFGKRMAILRMSMGLSQAKLSTRLGVSSSTVGMYEQGRREPSLDMLVRIARVLGVSTDYLLTGEMITTEETAEAVLRLLSRVMG